MLVTGSQSCTGFGRRPLVSRAIPNAARRGMVNDRRHSDQEKSANRSSEGRESPGSQGTLACFVGPSSYRVSVNSPAMIVEVKSFGCSGMGGSPTQWLGSRSAGGTHLGRTRRLRNSEIDDLHHSSLRRQTRRPPEDRTHLVDRVSRYRSNPRPWPLIYWQLTPLPLCRCQNPLEEFGQKHR